MDRVQSQKAVNNKAHFCNKSKIKNAPGQARICGIEIKETGSMYRISIYRGEEN